MLTNDRTIRMLFIIIIIYIIYLCSLVVQLANDLNVFGRNSHKNYMCTMTKSNEKYKTRCAYYYNIKYNAIMHIKYNLNFKRCPDVPLLLLTYTNYDCYKPISPSTRK